MSIERRLSRRRFLGGSGAAVLSAAGGIACPRLVFAQNKKPIKFTLAWVAEGGSLFAFVAKGMGFWDKHGLDVDIARGSGSVAAAQAIGEGRFDFGMASPSLAILQTIRGLPTVALACCAYDATMGIGIMNDGPIKTPKDLEGHKMASVATSGDYPFLPAFAEKAGFDLAKVDRIQVDNKVRDRLLPEGAVDAISGYASSAMPSYVATGVKAHFMLFSDYGIINYGTAVMTQPNRVAEEPQVCAAFVDGILQGLKATLLDPAEAIKVFFKQVPEMALATQAREQIRVGTGILTYVSAREIIKTNGLGYLETKDYEAMTDLVMKYLAKEGDQRPDIAKMMTNQFVGDLKPSPAEWEQMQKNGQEFRPYLS
ncbi:MAG TPA: ABC transporter substrate-binding protein [Stellaceae bacterium]|nr:ABC transporter substrate-binding protein [Stellaceae bacterium]